jgi:hypothetical protein
MWQYPGPHNWPPEQPQYWQPQPPQTWTLGQNLYPHTSLGQMQPTGQYSGHLAQPQVWSPPGQSAQFPQNGQTPRYAQAPLPHQPHLLFSPVTVAARVLTVAPDIVKGLPRSVREWQPEHVQQWLTDTFTGSSDLARFSLHLSVYLFVGLSSPEVALCAGIKKSFLVSGLEVLIF